MPYISPSTSKNSGGATGYVSPTDEVIKSSIGKSVGSEVAGYISPSDTPTIRSQEVAAGETRDVPRPLRPHTQPVVPRPKTSVGDVAREVPGTVARGIKKALDTANTLQSDFNRGSLDLVNQARTSIGREPFSSEDEMYDASPISKILNNKHVKKIFSTIGEKTSNLGIKAVAGLQGGAETVISDLKKGKIDANKIISGATNPATIPALIMDSSSEENYKKYYEKLKKDREDPNNTFALKTLYDLQDAVPQTLIGALLYAAGGGPVASGAYFTAVSGAGQIKEKGKVDFTETAIDVAGDQLLGGVLEGVFKKPAKSILGAFVKGFGTEGGTEVSQTLLKYANNYKNARTTEEKQSVLDTAKRYVKEGGLLSEFLVGGIAGGGITAVGSAASRQPTDPAIIPGSRVDEGSLPQPELQPQAPVQEEGTGYVSPVVEEPTQSGPVLERDGEDEMTASKGKLSKFSIKDSDGNTSGSISVQKDPDQAYKILKVAVNPEQQGKGIATGVYEKINRESIEETGKPLQSSTQDMLTDDGRRLWESLVKKNLAEKTSEGYTMKVPESVKIQSLEQEINQAETLLDIAKERAAEHPGKALLRYRSNKTGQLPEIGNLTPEERRQMMQKREKDPNAKSFKGNYDQILSADNLNSQEYGTTYGDKDPNDLIKDYEKTRDSISELAAEVKRLRSLRGDVSTYTPKLTPKTQYDTSIEFSKRNPQKVTDVEPAKTPEEMVKRIEQLNKFGQSNAILRRTARLGKSKAGVFEGKKGTTGAVKLQDAVVLDPKEYMSTLAHELGHALEYNLVGRTNKDTYRVFGRDLPVEVKTKIKNELIDLTNKMEGEAVAKANPKYYYKDTELLARFFQYMFENPGDLSNVAPTAAEYIEKSAIETPIVGEFLEAVYGTIDKGAPKNIFLRDMRQIYQKYLGKRVGNMAWNDEVRYRGMKERAKVVIEKGLKAKFKGIKDSPEALFNAAEAIKVTKGGEPQFGTRDFQWAENDADVQKLKDSGYEVLKDENGDNLVEMVDGKPRIRFAKTRYTEDQGKAMFEELSPEGQKLIKDFTSDIEDAQDFFNREHIKNIYKINGDIEGWVHHYFDGDDSKGGIGGNKLKNKKAGTRKQRTGTEGYVRDLQKAMQKAMTELETEKQYNEFIESFFARVTEPIAKGEKPKPGYTEVAGTLRAGVGRPIENTTKIIKDGGKSIVMQPARYQMPTDIYQRYQLISELAVETSNTMRVINSLNRYWRVNILFHAGSATTNFLSGGIQYSAKVMTDFYTEVLTGNIDFKKTRSNLYAMFTVLTPRGWQDAPDWIYGGDMSNYYGEFGVGKTPGLLDKSIDVYADKTLKLYGAVERYWKKVIATTEGAAKLSRYSDPDSLGIGKLSAEEKEIFDNINKEIDLFAFDYDNVPPWLESFNRSAFGSAVKPFTKYPYKYSKMIGEMMGGVFDRSVPWQERTAKILALGTIMAIYAAIRHERKEEQKTQEVPETAPPSVSTRGRLFVGTDNEGREMFTRVAKYPFVNLTEAGAQFVAGNTNQGYQLIADQVGSVAPAGKFALAALGYRNEYEQYQPYPAILGKDLATFIPGTRVLSDISRFFDPFQRKQETFAQGFTSLIPTTDPDAQLRLHGPQRTIKVPVEGNIKRGEGVKRTRTTTDMDVLNFKSDILLSALTGIYVSRIDPDVAEAFIIRDEENKEKEAKKNKRQED